MRLLYLALDCPLPANNGLRLRTWMTLRALRAEGCQITLVCHQNSSAPRAAEELRQACDAYWMLAEQVASLSGHPQWGARLRSLGSALPYAALRFRSATVRDILRLLCAENRWDAVVCDSVYAAVNLPARMPPLIVNHHNIEHRILETYREAETQRWKRAAAGWEARKLRRWETSVGQRTEVNWVCSPADRDRLLEEQPRARVAVVPNVAPEPEAASGTEEEDVVIFQGALDWLPNRDAVGFFLERIWPAVRAARPGAQLLVAGRNPPGWFVARHGHKGGVTFTGTVTTMAPYLGRAAVAIAPLRMGSGTRLKILEAAAMGKPTVATPLGAEGLEFQPEREILVAEEPEAFAAAVVRLLASPRLRREMGAAARARIETTYSFGALCRSVRAGLAALPTASARAMSA